MPRLPCPAGIEILRYPVTVKGKILGLPVRVNLAVSIVPIKTAAVYGHCLRFGAMGRPVEKPPSSQETLVYGPVWD